MVCGQGVAPAAATLDAFRDRGLDLIPATGLLPAVVPGAFDAWCLMLRDWGTWELPAVLEYAIGYARNGIPIVPRISATIEGVRPLFEAEWKSSAAVFLPGGNVPAPNSLFARPALAATYERICREATGASREARIDAAAMPGIAASSPRPWIGSSGRAKSWTLPAAAIADCWRPRISPAWSASIEDPVAYDYNGHTVLKCGPWSQGPVLLQQLALLRGFDVGEMDTLGPISFT